MIVQRMMVRGVKSVPETWEITVNTEATTQGEKTTGIPLNLYGQAGVTVTVDWGDNTESVLTSEAFAENNSTASVHEYSLPGTYTISIKTKTWKNLYLLVLAAATSLTSSNKNDATDPLFYFKNTLISVDTVLPQIAGLKKYANTSATSLSTSYNDVEFLFSGCSKLVYIPDGMFDKNPDVTNIQYCFYDCSSLPGLPNGLFDKNQEITNIKYCFYNCSSLEELPDGLFDKNIKIAEAQSCFFQCKSLVLLPDGLFDKNISLNAVTYCFYNCQSLISIQEDLFRYNTDLTDVYACFYGCRSLGDFTLHIGSSRISNAGSFVDIKNDATRTIYVPSGSTTETTFNAVASSLGLTIIGE